jgi:Peptidase M10 serralysin C terminal
LRGLAGEDTLVGLRGRDVLTGGSEADVFMFIAQTDTGATASSRDRITDFKAGVDLIDLSSIDARSTTGSKGFAHFFSGNNAFSFIGTDEFSGTAGELHYEHARVGRATVTVVEGDINGNGVADFQIELTGRKALTAGDFVL